MHLDRSTIPNSPCRPALRSGDGLTSPRERRDSPFFVVFSIIFGIIAPVFCLAVWHVLLGRFDLPGLTFIALFPFFSYGVIGLEILVLSLWLGFADRIGAWSGLFAGILSAGSLFAGVLGLVLLPFSLIFLIFVIGALGLVPLFTAYAFFRNCRAYERARGLKGGAMIWAAPLLGMTLAFGVPGMIQVRVSLVLRSAIREIMVGDPAGTARLRAWFPSAYRDHLARSYSAERGPVSRERLARAFQSLTGEDIDSWAARFND